MSSDFDPYLQWLGIRDSQRPPNAYRLLGVELFESDPDVIHTAADRQMAHLRTFQHGAHAEESQQLLNEVAAARVLLLDDQRRLAYNKQLGKPAQPNRNIDDATEADRSPSTLTLRTPGRGRAERPWYFWVALASPMLLVALAVVGYRVARIHRLNELAQQTQAEQEASATSTPTMHQSGSEDAGTERNTLPQSGTPSDVGDSQAASEQTTDASSDRDRSTSDEDAAVPSEETTDQEDSEPPSPSQSHSSQQKGEDQPGAGDAGGGLSRDDQSTWVERLSDDRLQRWDDLPPWRAASPTIPPESITGQLMTSLADRDTAAANRLLLSIQTNAAVSLGPSQWADAELVIDAVDTFWTAVEQAAARLSIGDQLEYRQMAVTVRRIDEDRIELMSPVGEPRSFQRNVSDMPLPLAIALAQRYWWPSKPVAWRLAAAVAAVDRQGNPERASEYSRKAEYAGLTTNYLTGAIRRLQGLPERPLPSGLHGDSLQRLSQNESTTTESGGDAAQTAASADRPSRDQQRQARREVLSPELRRFRDEQIPRSEQAAALLNKSAAENLGRAAVYVLLKSAVSRATSSLDLDTAWAAIDRLQAEFSEDADLLRYKMLQDIARRKKGKAKRRYAQRAHELSRAAILRDDYENASRFASLAIEIAKPVDDDSFSDYLARCKKEVLEIKDAFHQLRETRDVLQRSPGDDWAQAKLATFEVLTKGHFNAMTEYREMASDRLKQLIEAEAKVGGLASRRAEMGDQWFQFAQTLEGVQKTNALRRARFWLNAAVADLTDQQAGAARQTLDAITQQIGRKSDRIDLTSMPPIRHTVGFGSFGINRNPDAGSGRTRPLPDIKGEKVTRYLWACAPSSLAYAVPIDARRFVATALLNAASQDGVRFVVLVDNQPVFQSPVIQSPGKWLEINVPLPPDAKELELRVDAGHNPVNDHTYWISPALLVDPVR